MEVGQFGRSRFLIGMIYVMMSVGCIYWFTMGAMMASEWPVLSRRVQRSLPESYIGRLFLSWFYPGPGTGFIFSIANLATIAVLSAITLFFGSTLVGNSGSTTDIEKATHFLLISFSYVVIFLGLGKILVTVFRKATPIPVAGSILIHGFLVAGGCFVPAMIELSMSSRSFGYSLLHITNPFYSIFEIVDRAGTSSDASALLVLVPIAAVVVFFINFPSISSELKKLRSEAPVRVLEDEEELHPTPDPETIPSSPWDNVDEV